MSASSQIQDHLNEILQLINDEEYAKAAGGVSGMLSTKAIWLPPVIGEQNWAQNDADQFIAFLEEAVTDLDEENGSQAESKVNDALGMIG